VIGLATLAAFGPHEDAQRCRLLHTSASSPAGHVWARCAMFQGHLRSTADRRTLMTTARHGVATIVRLRGRPGKTRRAVVSNRVKMTFINGETRGDAVISRCSESPVSYSKSLAGIPT
jgi:hypothetical protein